LSHECMKTYFTGASGITGAVPEGCSGRTGASS